MVIKGIALKYSMTWFIILEASLEVYFLSVRGSFYVASIVWLDTVPFALPGTGKSNKINRDR